MIPRLRVSGSHRDVGRAIGAATAPTLREVVAFDADLPAGRSRAEQLGLASRYRDATLAATPWLVEGIDGAAEGAGVDAMALFAASIEEIWAQPGAAIAYRHLYVNVKVVVSSGGRWPNPDRPTPPGDCSASTKSPPRPA